MRDEKLEAEESVREVWATTEMSGKVEPEAGLFEIAPNTLEDFSEGLPYIIAWLESLVETGEALASQS